MRLFINIILWTGLAVAQTSIQLGNYRFPSPIMSPGQVIPVFFKTSAPVVAGVTTSPQWPISFNGVELQFADYREPVRIWTARIRALDRLGRVLGTEQNVFSAEIQVPFDIASGDYYRYRFSNHTPINLNIKVDGEGVDSIPVMIYSNNVHLTGGCDGGSPFYSPPNIPYRALCFASISVNGRFFNFRNPPRESPIKADGTISLYAYGLGQTEPPATEGEPFTAEHKLVHPVRVLFDPNRTTLRMDRRDLIAAPVTYAGPIEGSVGLYRIDVLVPRIDLSRSQACGSNARWVTIVVEGTSSIDATDVCVAEEP